jgi:hypothetical protein
VATSTSTVNQGTQRTDNWQLAPLLTFLGFSAFIIYATVRAFQNAYFEVPGTQYLSPFYSPYLPHVFHTLGIHLPFLEAPGGLGWIVSPAIFILWVPAGFRTTCYYYRKAYYRSFFTAPVACAVDTNPKSPLIALLGSGKRYLGEKAFPLVMQNLHRFMFYVAALFILILAYDAFAAFFLPGYSGIHIGLGAIVFVVNVVLLAMYTFGCHSWRHIIGGRIDCFSSCGPLGHMQNHAWKRQSILNEHHMLFAWLSLFSVGFADLYVFLVSKGVWTDPVFYSATWKGIFG